MSANKWVTDGSIGAIEYLMTDDDQLYASVDLVPGHAGECAIWTPGCGLRPRRSQHGSIEAAKRHAESQIALLTGT